MASFIESFQLGSAVEPGTVDRALVGGLNVGVELDSIFFESP